MFFFISQRGIDFLRGGCVKGCVLHKAETRSGRRYSSKGGVPHINNAEVREVWVKRSSRVDWSGSAGGDSAPPSPLKGWAGGRSSSYDWEGGGGGGGVPCSNICTSVAASTTLLLFAALVQVHCSSLDLGFWWSRIKWVKLSHDLNIILKVRRRQQEQRLQLHTHILQQMKTFLSFISGFFKICSLSVELKSVGPVTMPLQVLRSELYWGDLTQNRRSAMKMEKQ